MAQRLCIRVEDWKLKGDKCEIGSKHEFIATIETSLNVFFCDV